MKPLYDFLSKIKDLLSFTMAPSATEQQEVDRVKKTLTFMSAGFLVIGAITSLSYTIPTSYALMVNILPYYITLLCTIIIALLNLLLIDFAMGVLTPFSIKFLVSGAFKRSRYATIGGVMLFAIPLLLTYISVSFTQKGSHYAITTALGSDAEKAIDHKELLSKKEKALEQVNKEYEDKIAYAKKQDADKMEEIEAYWKKEIALQTQKASLKYDGRIQRGDRGAIGKKAEMIHAAEKKRSSAIASFNPSVDKVLQQKERAQRLATDGYGYAFEQGRKTNERAYWSHQKEIELLELMIKTLGMGASFAFWFISFINALLYCASTNDGIYKNLFPTPPKVIKGKNSSKSFAERKPERAETADNQKVLIDLERFSKQLSVSEAAQKFQSYRGKFQRDIGDPNTNLSAAAELFQAISNADPKKAQDLKIQTENQDPIFMRMVLNKEKEPNYTMPNV